MIIAITLRTRTLISRYGPPNQTVIYFICNYCTKKQKHISPTWTYLSVSKASRSFRFMVWLLITLCFVLIGSLFPLLTNITVIMKTHRKLRVGQLLLTETNLLFGWLCAKRIYFPTSVCICIFVVDQQNPKDDSKDRLCNQLFVLKYL